MEQHLTIIRWLISVKKPLRLILLSGVLSQGAAACGAGGAGSGAGGHGTGSGSCIDRGGGVYVGIVEAGSGCFTMGGLGTGTSGSRVTVRCREKKQYTCPLFRRTWYLAPNGSYSWTYPLSPLMPGNVEFWIVTCLPTCAKDGGGGGAGARLVTAAALLSGG